MFSKSRLIIPSSRFARLNITNKQTRGRSNTIPLKEEADFEAERDSGDSSESIAKYVVQLAILKATQPKTNLAALQKDAFLVFRSLCKVGVEFISVY